MKVTFNDESGLFLGSSQFDQISEILIPGVTGGYDYFIKQRFVSKPTISTWHIMSIQFNGIEVTIVLNHVEVPLSVSKFASPQHQKEINLLCEYGIVEVDFGFYSHVFDVSGQPRKNDSNTGALLTGEMHKKRPCIVIKLNQSTVQVIPLTSSTNRINSHIGIKVDLSRVPKLSNRYHIDTYALIGMIQTVSYDRVFPPKSNDTNNKYKHTYFDYKLSTVDREAIKAALAGQYNPGVAVKIQDLENQLIKLSKEKGRVFASSSENLKKLGKAQERVSELENLILKIGVFFSYGEELEEVCKRLTYECNKT